MIVHDGVISESVPIKRGRGRPKGTGPSEKDKAQDKRGNKLKNKRGRPKKYFYPEDLDQDSKTSITGEREVIKCCALGCTNTSASFVMCRLPTERHMFFQWIRKIGRPGWKPVKDAALCQIHFEPDMWIHDPKLRLKKSAMPSMFLQGENIKSWVTMDHSGNVRNLVVGAPVANGSVGSVEDGGDEMDIEGVSIKSEVLEPVIDMVVGGVDEETFTTEFDHSRSKAGSDCPQPDLKIKSVWSQEAECILPDLYSPAGPDTDLGVHLLARDQGPKVNLKVFTCPLCSKNLARRRSLVLHMQKIHPGTEETKKIMEERARMHRRRKVLKTEPSPPPPPAPAVVSEASDLPSVKPAVTAVGTSPAPLAPPAPPDPSKVKPFFLLIPANFQPASCPPLIPSGAPPTPAVPPNLASSAWDASDMFCVTLKPLPLDTRTALKRKLMDLVEAVTVRNIPPQKIIIAYSNGKEEDKPGPSTPDGDKVTPPVIDVS